MIATLVQNVGLLEIFTILLYLLVVIYLGWLGYRQTKNTSDYLLAGRNVHPFVMALSYGATFISTSAIVGFGGVAGLFGMSLLWLVFLNILFGIFIAFVCFGSRTRRMGHRLDAHTFPEFIGRRFQSKFIQIFAALIIFLFMPLYASAVLIGGCEFLATRLGIHYNVALLVFSVLVAAYVITGGLKGVMYSDALQGSIMFIGMLVLLIFTYAKVGGITEGHRTLSDLAPLVPSGLQSIGHQGWTAMPIFGFGGTQYNLWWTVVGTLTLGVGIGVLAQPQLVVRFMTVKSKRELNRAVLIGGIFILITVGVVYVVGSLSNAYFTTHGEPFTGRIVKLIDEEKGYALLQPMQQNDAKQWVDAGGNPIPVVLSGEETIQVNQSNPIVQGRSISIVYAKGNAGQIIPRYITSAMPHWFGLIFLLTLLSAAMSTISSQFHTVGTSVGRDIYERITGKHKHSITINRIGIIIGILLAVFISFHARESTMIARATAIFFGLCASTFLPTFVGGLFFKRMTKAGAIASMVTGFTITTFWLLFVKAQEAGAIGLVQLVTNGKKSILAGYPNWPVVDPILIALPVATIVAVIVSLTTTPPDSKHVIKCFGKTKEQPTKKEIGIQLSNDQFTTYL